MYNNWLYYIRTIGLIRVRLTIVRLTRVRLTIVRLTRVRLIGMKLKRVRLTRVRLTTYYARLQALSLLFIFSNYFILL